ncbi:MAG TPA: hypothetical protein VHQ65_12430 [Thermoanaerobaculia bacterium]|nr:hypothetical protein [Thermoanaerobaculia bacterium]
MTLPIPTAPTLSIPAFGTRRLLRALRPLLVAAVLAGGLAGDAAACSCMEPGPPAQELENADAVFTGRVVALEPFTEGFRKVRVTFDLIDVWKGLAEGDRVTLTTAADTATCGYPFEEGGSYLVYAYGEEDALTATLCSRTRPLRQAEEDREALGEPQRHCG